MNSVMVALPLSLSLLIVLLPYCSSRQYATKSKNVAIDFPLTAFLASSRLQRHRGGAVGGTDAAASASKTSSACFGRPLHQQRSSSSLCCMGACLQHNMFSKPTVGIISSRGNTNKIKWGEVASSKLMTSSSIYHVSPSTSTSTTLYSSRSSSSRSSEYSDDEIDRFHNANVAGVSVSPQGFLVLLQSEFDSNNNAAVGVGGVHDNDDDGGVNVDVGDKESAATSGLTFPILLTSAPLQDAPISANVEDNVSSNSSSIELPQLPELFRLNNNMDQTSVSSPEALTYLQLLNGVDMATPVLPPDILSLVCVWYAFLLLEEEEESSPSEEGGAGMENGNLVVVEDELGLNDSNNDDAMTTTSADKCRNEFQDALDYIRAMVRTTLPPERNNILSGSSASASYLEASPRQRSKVQLPRVWLRGVRMQEVMMAVGENVGIEVDRSSTTTTGDAITTTIGRVPIQFTLECSVDDGSKMLEIPLFAIPTPTVREQQSTQQSVQHQVEARLVEISNELLQELSHNYNVESSASFLSLALFQRYSIKSSGGRGGLNSSSSVPTLTVSNGFLQKFADMQQHQDAIKKNDDDSIGARTKYCWVLPPLDDRAMKNNDVDNNIDKVIQCQGLPFYRPLSQIREEGQRGLLKRDSGGSDIGVGTTNTNDGSVNEQRRRKTKPLTLEQQAMQQKLLSAWKVASQRKDAGALERIQQAMEALEREVTYDDDDDDEGEESTLKIIQRAMQLNKDKSDRLQMPPGDGNMNASQSLLPQDEEVVGLISELEEATLNSSMGDNNVETDTDER